MRLRKKHRNALWYAYVVALVVYYEVVMAVAGFSVTGFLVAFGGIGLITFGFVIFMRRLSRPAAPIITRPTSAPVALQTTDSGSNHT